MSQTELRILRAKEVYSRLNKLLKVFFEIYMYMFLEAPNRNNIIKMRIYNDWHEYSIRVYGKNQFNGLLSPVLSLILKRCDKAWRSIQGVYVPSQFLSPVGVKSEIRTISSDNI